MRAARIPKSIELGAREFAARRTRIGIFGGTDTFWSREITRSPGMKGEIDMVGYDGRDTGIRRSENARPGSTRLKARGAAGAARIGREYGRSGANLTSGPPISAREACGIRGSCRFDVLAIETAPARAASSAAAQGSVSIRHRIGRDRLLVEFGMRNYFQDRMRSAKFSHCSRSRFAIYIVECSI